MENGTGNGSFKKYGGFIGGGLMLAAIVTIAVIGKNTSGSSDVKMRYAMDEYNERTSSSAYTAEDVTSAEEEAAATQEKVEETYAMFLGIDQYKLRYEARVMGLKDEVQKYTVQFDCDLPEDIEQTVLDEIAKKCGKNADDNQYGEVSVELRPEERKLFIMLDASHINTMNGLSGIFRALDNVQGVKSVILNEDLEGYYTSQYDAVDQSEE